MKSTCNAPSSAASTAAAATALSLETPWDQPGPQSDVPAVSLPLAVAPYSLALVFRFKIPRFRFKSLRFFALLRTVLIS